MNCEEFKLFAKKCHNFSPDELEILVRCMESNPQLAYGKTGGNLPNKKLMNAAWDAVTAEVNSASLGINRTSHQMKVEWYDYKYKVRQKATTVTMRSGSFSDQQKLTPLELRVLSLIGPGRVKAVTNNDFDTGAKQVVPCEIAKETSVAQIPVSCAVDHIDGQTSVLIKQEDENEENNVLCNELSSVESRLLTEENGQTDILTSSQIKKEGQTDILTSSQIKKEVEFEMQESLHDTMYSSAVHQENEDCKVGDAQYTVLIPVQFPLLQQENGQNKSTCIQTASVHQPLLPQKETEESERFFIQNGAIIPVQSRLSEQDYGNETDLIQTGTVISVHSSLLQQENERSGKNNLQNSPVIHVLSRFSEQQNVDKDQNANQSHPIFSNESNLPKGLNGERSESALKITSVISKSSQQGKGRNKKSVSNPTARLDEDNSSQEENDPSNDTVQNWQLTAPSAKGSGTVGSQRLRSRKRKLKEEEENAVERQVFDTPADMANELRKMTTHLATIANTNIEILKYLKNVEKKQETVISYLSAALNLNGV